MTLPDFPFPLVVGEKVFFPSAIDVIVVAIIIDIRMILMLIIILIALRYEREFF